MVFVYWRQLTLLHLTQRHCGVKPNQILKPKCRIEGFSECGAKGVEVDQCVTADSVEGQRAGRPVQIHRYSVWGRGGRTYGCHSVIVEDRVTIPRAAHAPRRVTEAEAAVSTFSSPSYSSVSRSYRYPPFPLHLPVTAASQTICTQQLLPVVESLRVIKIWLHRSHQCHRSVILRQREVSVGCVWVQGDFTGIWWRAQETVLNVSNSLIFIHDFFHLWCQDQTTFLCYHHLRYRCETSEKREEIIWV